MDIAVSERQPVQSRVTSSQRQQMVWVGLGIALAWWLVGFIMFNDPNIQGKLLYIWGDQQWTFMKADQHLLDPYAIVGYLNPPWVIVILAPFAMMPFTWSMLAQMILYFVGMALLLAKYGGSMRTLVLVSLSPLALNHMIELNIDWLVVWALLVPPAYSGPLMLAKPQLVLGYLVGFKWRELVRWVLVMVVLALVTLLIWGDWPLAWLANIGSDLRPLPNTAPNVILGWGPSLLIGIPFAFYAWRKRDSILGIFAGMFFMPYIASYSFLLYFGLFLARWRKAGLILWMASWIAFVALVVMLRAM
ncbi:MAG: hypothetical protein CL607_22735 [Anaerolineaceae bacterium]|nr:hypothetical protein [Anaerolineaceae bacterium]